MRTFFELLDYSWALFRINSRAALALRASFFTQSVFMFLNNGMFFVVWILIYSKVDSIRGWRLQDCALMFGISASAFGAILLIFGGVINLARAVSEGEMDTYLAQPKPLLSSALGSHSNVSGWGDLLSGLAFIVIAGYAQPLQIVYTVLSVLCAAILFLSTGVILHSSAFWLGPVNHLARQLHEWILTFSLYPGPIYAGWLRVAIFTLLPAGFITTLPVELIREASLEKMLIVVGATAVYAFVALKIFHAGIHRYESGSRFAYRV